jgi:hypothetical protein
MKMLFATALTAFAVLSFYAATSATAKEPSSVVCVRVEFTAPKGSGRGVYFYYETVEKAPPMSAAIKKQVISCMSKQGPSSKGFVAFFPYLKPGIPWKWRVEAAACLTDRSAYYYQGIMSPAKKAHVIMKDKIGPGNKYCKD